MTLNVEIFVMYMRNEYLINIFRLLLRRIEVCTHLYTMKDSNL